MSAPISASGSASQRGDGALRLSPAVALAVLVGATLAARLIAGALVPLSEDEAYYRLWSLRPALGYFDHPPMVAWWIWLGRQIAGDTALGVRLMPALGAAATTLLIFDLARVAGFGERIALRAAIWFNATILIGLGGELAVPDVPNTLFWTAALCCAFRAMQGGRGAWWLGAGVAAGLACLSKYSALFLAPGVVLWLLLTKEGRRQLATPWPWLAAVIAIAIYSPNVWWNAQHHWETFQKQFGRVAASGLAPGYFLKLVGDQFLLLNPLIAVFVIGAAVRRAAWPMLVIAAPFVLYLVVHSLHDAVQGQWPSPLYPLLMIAAATIAEGVTGWRAVLRTAAPWFGFGLCAAAMIYVIAPDPGLLTRDPAWAYRGWPAFFANVERVRTEAGAAWIGAPTYGLAAQLASTPTIHAPATEIYERERFSFEVPAERADFTKPGLIVSPPKSAAWPALNKCFASVRQLPDIVRGAGRGTPYTLYLVSQPRRDMEIDGCYRPDLPNF
ncbi:MAG TPA: glycosyltransferase family 39 protein [Caulobacteraceae bacterium]|jgi:4-amino-4-deoxy-L-arabinose transferase-like glycosyltransferase|nr:glycosyltransferase family 39 protein [Caulobacteraceae bacterium]